MSIAYHMGPILDTMIKYNVMQNKNVPMENMDFYFRYDSADNAEAVTLQQVKIKNGIKEKDGSRYFINGDRNSKNTLTKLSLARGTLKKVFERKNQLVAFGEIGNNGVVERALNTALQNLPILIDEINRADRAQDYDER